MKKSLKIFLCVASVALVCSLLVTAYFTFSKTQDETVTISPDLQTVEVGDFEELFFATQTGSYNDKNGTASTTTERKTVKLTADITLVADLEITADVHLDLGGFTLALNGHTLTFRHSYHGSVVLSGGNVKCGKSGDNLLVGAVVIDLPNSALLCDNVTFQNANGETATDTTAIFTVLSSDAEFIAYNFFWSVASAVADESNTLVPRENYTEIGDKTTFTASDFITYFNAGDDNCTNHSDVPCSYVFADVDLPMHYIGYPNVTVSYTTQNGNLSTYGKKVSAGLDVLTATVTVGETVCTCTFNLHISDGSDSDVLTMAKRYLAKYYVETVDKDSSGEQEDLKKYVINHDCYLPTKFGFSDSTIVWQGLDDSSTAVVSPSTASSPFTLFQPTHATTQLRATVGSSSETFQITSSNVATVRNATTVANDLLKKWYGTEIAVIAHNDDTYTFSDPEGSALSGYLPLHTIDYYKGSEYETAYPGVNSIEYSVVYGDTVDEYYEIADLDGDTKNKSFKVVSGKHPENDAGSVYLNVKMNVTYNGKADDVVIQMPVRCDVSGGQGQSRFMPYYSVFNKSIDDQTGNYTLASFEMPLCYRDGKPIVSYALSVRDGYTATTLDRLNSAVKMYFVDKDGNEKLLTGKAETVSISSNGETTTRDVISYTASLATAVTDLATQANAGTAHYKITIDSSVLDVNNLGLSLTYLYKFDVSASAWTAYSLTTDVTIPGVLHTSDIPDTNFYSWIYLNFNSTGDKTYDTGDLIYTDWLTANVALNYTSDTTLASVTDFTGLKYLVGTQTLNLQGCTKLTTDNIEEIALMKSLTSINLRDCGISVTNSGTSPFDSWGADTSCLTNLTLLDLRSNTIYKFDWLENLANKAKSLTTVYLSGNIPNTSDTDFNDPLNVFYGSDGLSNYGTYHTLASNGITIYSGGDASSPTQFADSSSTSKLYLSLCGLEYQNNLPNGVDIRCAFEDLSKNTADYGITEVKNTKYSCDKTSDSIVFAEVDENTFSLTYTAVVDGTNYTMVLKFSVTRS